MEWRDDGIILGVRQHGETAAVVTLLTHAHGRHSGLVRGARSKKLRGVLQPGNRVAAHWRARLEEHLGTMTAELTKAHTAPILGDPGRLSALASAVSLVDAGLPEREPHGDLFENLDALMVALDSEHWAETYCLWELGLLGELGFGLDLSACAVTGETENLLYVSPKTGRAVSGDAGQPYRDRLLALPTFLITRGSVTSTDICAALRLSGHFLQRHVFSPHGKPLPDPRARLMAQLCKEQIQTLRD